MCHFEKLEALRLRTTRTCVFTLATLMARKAGDVAGATVVERAMVVSDCWEPVVITPRPEEV
jgi:hypothetical protein